MYVEVICMNISIYKLSLLHICDLVMYSLALFVWCIFVSAKQIYCCRLCAVSVTVSVTFSL